MYKPKPASRASLPRGIPAHIALAKAPAPKPGKQPPPKARSTLFQGVGTLSLLIILSYLMLITLG